MTKKQVLCWTTVDAGLRVYFSKNLMNVLGVGIGDRVSFDTSGRYVKVVPAENNGQKIDTRQRVCLPKEVTRRLKLDIGTDVIFLQRGKNVRVCRLDNAIRW